MEGTTNWPQFFSYWVMGFVLLGVSACDAGEPVAPEANFEAAFPVLNSTGEDECTQDGSFDCPYYTGEVTSSVCLTGEEYDTQSGDCVCDPDYAGGCPDDSDYTDDSDPYDSGSTGEGGEGGEGGDGAEDPNWDFCTTFTDYAPPYVYGNFNAVHSYGTETTLEVRTWWSTDTEVYGELKYYSDSGWVVTPFIGATTVKTAQGDYWAPAEVRFKGIPYGTALTGRICDGYVGG